MTLGPSMRAWSNATMVARVVASVWVELRRTRDEPCADRRCWSKAARAASDDARDGVNAACQLLGRSSGKPETGGKERIAWLS